MTSSPAVGVDEVLAALRSVPGVRAADIDHDEVGGPGLLRLDLANDVDEVEVATSVGRVLRERFGLGVDAGQVQMVEAASNFASAAVPANPDSRDDAGAGDEIRVAVMNVTSAGRKVVVSLVLERGAQECRGEAVGVATTEGIYRAVASATLHAVEELTQDIVIGRVEQLEVGDGAASVTLVLDVDGVDVTASAISPVHVDPRQAIVRAVLEAVQPHLPASQPA